MVSKVLWEHLLIEKFLVSKKKNQLLSRAQECTRIKNCYSTIEDVPKEFLWSIGICASRNSYLWAYSALKISFERFLSSAGVNLKVAQIGYQSSSEWLDHTKINVKSSNIQLELTFVCVDHLHTWQQHSYSKGE